jgi:hypothetical protein
MSRGTIPEEKLRRNLIKRVQTELPRGAPFDLYTLAMAMIVQGWRGWITSSDATTVKKSNETPAGPTS